MTVTAAAPAAFANSTAARKVSPLAKAVASAPQNASPAPVVSTGSTAEQGLVRMLSLLALMPLARRGLARQQCLQYPPYAHATPPPRDVPLYRCESSFPTAIPFRIGSA